jgi:hypothetical protein
MELFKRHSKIKKPMQFNPHQYWTILLCGFFVALIAELLYFSWFFMSTTEALDAPSLPSLETNALKIDSMEKKIKAVESAIQSRTGASQNTGPVVQ